MISPTIEATRGMMPSGRSRHYILPTDLLASHQKVRGNEELNQLLWGSKAMEDQANRPHRKPKEKKKHTGGKLRQPTRY